MNLDLFAGLGGWEAADGWDAVGLEFDPWACATRHAAGLTTIRADVARYPLEALVGKVEGLVASPPCQDWSRAGKRQKLASERGRLIYQPLRWVEALRPRWVALEQVPDVLEVWWETAWRLGQLGYSTWTGILNAADYGVPQTRQRAILIASRVRKVRPPEPTHSDQRRAGCLFGQQPWVSMAEALGWNGEVIRQTVHRHRQTSEPAPTVTGGGHKGGGPRWVLRTNQQSGWIATSSGNDYGHDYEREITRPSPSMTSRADRWTLSRPATTVQGDPRVGRPGHKHRDHGEGQFDSQAVRITLAEALILQGFPPDYPVQGTKTARFAQVGNAIPPPLAKAIRLAAGGA